MGDAVSDVQAISIFAVNMKLSICIYDVERKYFESSTVPTTYLGTQHALLCGFAGKVGEHPHITIETTGVCEISITHYSNLVRGSR